MAIEKCVICGKDTAYNMEDHIDKRTGYLEGMGQLCNSCHQRGTGREMFAVPIDMIEQTPNDFELGNKVRQFYNRNK